jgi:hypothetical protein
MLIYSVVLYTNLDIGYFMQSKFERSVNREIGGRFGEEALDGMFACKEGAD